MRRGGGGRHCIAAEDTEAWRGGEGRGRSRPLHRVGTRCAVSDDPGDAAQRVPTIPDRLKAGLRTQGAGSSPNDEWGGHETRRRRAALHCRRRHGGLAWWRGARTLSSAASGRDTLRRVRRPWGRGAARPYHPGPPEGGTTNPRRGLLRSREANPERRTPPL